MKTKPYRQCDPRSGNFMSRRQLLFKIFCLGVGVWAVGSVGAQTPGEDANLLKNGSFEEEGMKAGQTMPADWDFGSFAGSQASDAHTGVYIESEQSNVHSGLHATGIISAETTDASSYATWRSKKVEVTPGSIYEVKGWIKTADCVGKGAWMWIIGYDNPKGEMMPVGKPLTPLVQYFVGTQDWQQWSVEIKVSENIRLLEVACRLDGEGKAWFDDVSVSLVK